MAKQPSFLPYNDLNGQETTEILVDWFRQLLSKQPLLQPHLTLPMADIHLTIHVGVDMHVGGTVPVASVPDHIDISGDVTVRNAVAGPSGAPGPQLNYRVGVDTPNGSTEFTELSTRINAAPLPGGSPPDQIRDSHNLPILSPRYGPRETGSHLFLSDVIDATAERVLPPLPPPTSPIPTQARTPVGRVGVVADGYVFAPECPTTAHSLEQTIPLATGRIDIDLSGDGKLRTGRSVSEMGPMAKSSVKSFGDSAGHEYGAVTGTMDAGPAGLARGGGNKGLGGDGRARLSFGNNR